MSIVAHSFTAQVHVLHSSLVIFAVVTSVIKSPRSMSATLPRSLLAWLAVKRLVKWLAEEILMLLNKSVNALQNQ